MTGAGIFNVLSSWLGHHTSRYLFLQTYLPLGVIRTSWLLSVFAGIALFLLGWGLLKRKRRAWWLTATALTVATAAHLLKGLDCEAAIINMALFSLLLRFRQSYIVASEPASFTQSLSTLAVLTAVLYVYGLFGFYLLDRHFGTHFYISSAAKEAGRVMFTGASPSYLPKTHRAKWFLDSLWFGEIIAVGYGTGIVFRPVIYRRRVKPGEVRLVKRILNEWGRSSLAHLLLLPDKSYFFSTSKGSAIGYTVVGNVAIALGDPVGPPAETEKTVHEFIAYCKQHDWYPTFFQILPDSLTVYGRAGLELLKVGEEAVVDLNSFSLEGRAMKTLRQAVNRVKRQGYRVEFHQPPLSDDLIGRLKQVSDSWLKKQRGGEKRFSLGWFTRRYIRECPVAVVVDSEGNPVAFANIIPGYRLSQGVIDLMRRLPEAPGGVMELLFVSLSEYFKNKGLNGLNLGLAPLAGLGAPGSPPIEKAARLFYEHFNAFYSFKGVRQFKEKFNPRWEPRYLAYPASWLLPKVALAIVRANAGGGLSGYLRALKFRNRT